jgi:hypothetical protein
MYNIVKIRPRRSANVIAGAGNKKISLGVHKKNEKRYFKLPLFIILI